MKLSVRSLTALVVFGVGALVGSANVAAQTRSYTGGAFTLELDGRHAGFVSSASGGETIGVVATHRVGDTAVVKKHLSDTYIEPISLDFGAGMGQPLWDWIAATLVHQHKPVDGALVGVERQSKSVQRLDFYGAFLSELTIPKLDGSSKDALVFSVKILPTEAVQSKSTPGGVPVVGKTKVLLSSNFRFELDGLDCRRVTKIDAFTIKQKLATEGFGMARFPVMYASELEIPHITVTMAAVATESWQGWYEDFVVQGKSEDSNEKSGRIIFLGPDLQEELFEIKLHNVGIFALRSPSNTANKDTIAQVEAQLYVERMELITKPAP